MNTTLTNAEMERAYRTRDANYEGLYVLGVRTTGIFCRPTCPARSPLPKNVEYFPSASKAVFAGYRPCKRCRPMQIANQPDWCTRLLAQVDADPTRRIREADLHQWNVDPATVRRHFLKHYGMTFQAYSRARRLTAAFQSIRNGKTTDAAAYSHGYESLSGFRAAFGQSLGCTPGSCASTDRIVLAWIDTPLGPMVAGANDEGLCQLEFTDRRMLEAQFDTIRRYFPVPILPGSHPHLDRVRNELDRYFARSLRRFTVPVVFPGTPFQRRVWEELRNIPYGETRSYQDLARSLGNPNAVRAVGRSNGFNRIGIVIPCHRVVNANGDLGGYGGGLRRKQYLLNLELSNK